MVSFKNSQVIPRQRPHPGACKPVIHSLLLLVCRIRKIKCGFGVHAAPLAVRLGAGEPLPPVLVFSLRVVVGPLPLSGAAHSLLGAVYALYPVPDAPRARR